MMPPRLLHLLGLMLLGAACGVGQASAQTGRFSIQGGTVTSGGQTSTNATYRLEGTPGQPLVAKSAAGRFEVEVGFWALVVALQTPGAPELRVVREAGIYKLRWARSAVPDWILEASPRIGPTAVWTPTTDPITEAGADREAIIGTVPGHRFFRLRRP